MIHYPLNDIVRVFNLDGLIDNFIYTYTSTAPHRRHLHDLLLECFGNQRMIKYHYVVDENAWADYFSTCSELNMDLFRKFNDYIDMICGDEETLNYIIIER